MLPQPSATIPAFDPFSHGTPVHWNDMDRVWIFNKKTSHRIPDYKNPIASISPFLDFLNSRFDRAGTTLPYPHVLCLGAPPLEIRACFDRPMLGGASHTFSLNSSE